MSGKGGVRGIFQGQGGQCDRGGQVKGRTDKGYINYVANPKHKGLCSALVIHVFDYGHNASAYQMRTTS